MRLTTVRVLLACSLAFTFAHDAAASAAKEWSFRTVEKCGVLQFKEEWATANVAKMSWSGECGKGSRKLVVKDGTLTVTLKDGRSIRFTGTMKKGAYAQGEEIAADGTRFVGTYQPWRNGRAGKQYRPDGTLEFDGEKDGWGADNGIGFARGVYYSADGQFAAQGSFMQFADKFDIVTGEGAAHLTVYDRTGAAVRYLAYGMAVTREQFAEYAAQAAEMEKSAIESNATLDRLELEADQQAQQARKQSGQSSGYLWGALGAALGGASTGRTYEEQLANANAALTKFGQKSLEEGAQTGFTGALTEGAQVAGGGTGMPAIPGFTPVVPAYTPPPMYTPPAGAAAAPAAGPPVPGSRGYSYNNGGGYGVQGARPGSEWQGRGGIARDSARVWEVRKGPTRFDLTSNSGDQSGCAKAVIEDTGKKTLVNGVYEADVWILLVSDCAYDIQVGYCFEINQQGYSCATAYPNGPRGDSTGGYASDRSRRVNLRFNGDRSYLLNPNQRVFMGACLMSGTRIHIQHKYDANGFTFSCMEQK